LTAISGVAESCDSATGDSDLPDAADVNEEVNEEVNDATENAEQEDDVLVSDAPTADEDEVTDESAADENDESAEQERLDLEVEVETVSTCERRATVTVSRDEIERYYDKEFSDLVEKAELPGFRAGRAPRKLVEKRYRKELKDQIKGQVLQDGIAQVARDHGVLLAVDNTFTTPRGFQPLARGADIVVHSVTKLLAGHSDATLGYVVARDPALREALYIANTSWGITASPFDCWLAERGMHTFEMRYDRAEATATRLADALAEMPGVIRVLHPSRRDHPDHNRIAQVLGDRPGNMLSFEVAGGRAAANALTRAARNIPFAPTLGDVATTLSHPASSSHRAMTEAERTANGISEGFFRVSVGLEDPALLISELSDAIRQSQSA